MFQNVLIISHFSKYLEKSRRVQKIYLCISVFHFLYMPPGKKMSERR
jgi:hypothetical protein